MLKFRSVITRTIISTRPFPWLPRYTTAATAADTSNVVTDYLVSSLDFSKDEAFKTSLKLTSFKSTKQPKSVIRFLKRGKFTKTQIKNMVLKWPKLLTCNVDKTLNPKTQVFYDCGFTRSDVAHILSVCPHLFGRSLNDHFVPTIAALKTVFSVKGEGEKPKHFMTAVKQLPSLLSVNASVLLLLQSYGLTPSQIRKFAVRKPQCLSLATDVFQLVLSRAEKLGISRKSPMFFHGIVAMCSITEENLELRKDVYMSYGFAKKDLRMLGRKNPLALLISEPRLRKGLEFFINVAGFSASEIAKDPKVLMFSYEKRILPRYDVWKCLMEKGKMKANLVSCLALTEAHFFDKYMVSLKDECPDLYHDYVKRVQPVTEAAK